jgi:hypothetical protein
MHSTRHTTTTPHAHTRAQTQADTRERRRERDEGGREGEGEREIRKRQRRAKEREPGQQASTRREKCLPKLPGIRTPCAGSERLEKDACTKSAKSDGTTQPKQQEGAT